ncbi:MAG: hypothetical protein IT379_16250 [Deltaproteobacteria bacterium]|nr:hypothetical protein [Deltaproteobacteria bacterium]
MSDACPPYVCDAASGMCNVSCDDTSDCIAGYDCALGVCRRARGQPCTLDTECASGFCTDGICCEARCDGECERCDASGRIGFCDAVPAGDDPDAECGATACGTTGTCSGDRSCARHPMGATCGPASCMSATISNQPDVCNAGEMCVDSGTRDCSPGTCDPATGLCRTTCMTTAECAANHTCVGGTCRRNDGQPCVAGTECVSNNCCAGFCRNVTNDINNCGACGTACTNAHGTTSCSGSMCQPVCNPSTAWGNCDGNRPNGCETDLQTLSNCGGCGVGCSLPNASESCSTGSCTITGCSLGFSHCDTSQANGCEVNHSAYTGGMCGSATDVGTYDGDRDCGFICGSNTGWDLFASRSGTTSAWFKARVREDSDCPVSIEHRIRLDVPPDADYDLYVWRNCGAPSAWSENLTGVDESVTINEGESTGSDDSFDYWVEIRWFSGSTCTQWTVYFEGHNC